MRASVTQAAGGADAQDGTGGTGGTPGGAPGVAGAGRAQEAVPCGVPGLVQAASEGHSPGSFVLDTVPALNEEEKRHLARVYTANNAIEFIAPEEAQSPLDVAQQPLLARLGQAMHRLLEWAPVRSGGYALGQQPWSAAQALAVQRAFALDAEQGAQVLAQASAVLQGQGAWAWDAEVLAWHSNEVPLVAQGRALRLDRLVRRRDSGQWWVLDHKSSTHPLAQRELCAQLAAYVVAVRALVGAGEVVCGAFLSPDGLVWELHGV